LPAPTPEQREYAELLLERARSDLGALRVLPESIQEARWLTPWAAQLRYEMLEPLERDAAFSVAADAVKWASALLAV
jgi:hypothetical protein